MHGCVKEKMEQSTREETGLEAMLKKRKIFSQRMEVVYARRQYGVC